MRKRFYILLIIVLFFTLIYFFNKNTIENDIYTTIDKLSIPYKITALYSHSPDDSLSMPIKGINPSDITDTWTADREGGRLHQGQDIFAKKGTPIFSATEGIIVNVGGNKLGGNTVMILGSGGRRYYYAHLSSYGSDAVFGNEVGTSTLIGYVGNTGNASGTPSHLHFGIYTNNGPINPLPLLTDG